MPTRSIVEILGQVKFSFVVPLLRLFIDDHEHDSPFTFGSMNFQTIKMNILANDKLRITV